VAGYDPEARTRLVADVIRRLTGALAARDGETIVSLLADDVVYHLPGSNPAAGTFRGRDEVDGVVPPLPHLPGWLAVRGHPRRPLERSPRRRSQTFTATRGGRSHTWRAVRIYHLADERVAEIFVTIEDQAACDAFLSG
jgi:ketosteroid isomerase-like protein